MKRTALVVPAYFTLAAALACTAPQPLEYPPARRSAQVDEYHGTRVADPYRWLEDPDSPETREWIEAENELTFAYLGEIPARERIRERLTELWDFERYSIPTKRGGRYFFTRNDGLQNQAVLYVSDSLGGAARELLDPNTLSEDGTISLASYVPSEDGKLLAYGLSDGGSDWREWHVRDVETGRDLADAIRWNKFGGVVWAKDSSGLYYSRYDRPAEGAKLQERNAPPDLFFHMLGTGEDYDVLVLRRPEAEGVMHGFTLSEDGRSIVVTRRQVSTRNNELHLLDLTADTSPRLRPLVEGFDARYTYVGDDGGDVFWIRTDLDAPRWRVVAVDRRDTARSAWKEVVPESQDTLESVRVVGDHFVVSYLKHATTDVRVFDTAGRPIRSVDLPGIGSVRGFGGEPDDPETFYSFTSFTQPPSIYRYDVSTGRSRLFRRPELLFDPSLYATKQVFYESGDGTRVPMFVTHRRGLELDGSHPTYLHGYGGFNISLKPSYSTSNLVWLEMGGVLAVANLRGGGEYGKEWHEAGTKLRKQNVFDDFIAAAEWLIENDYTRPEKLAIGGGSNGGLLVGACVTQRPDLFGAALPAVGVMDMLRYHRFTIGWAWAGDYGTSDDAAQFGALHAYSPLHNLRAGTPYPATLVTTADHDDRVVPAHSFKFAAAMQSAQSGPEPVLIRIETRAGHGAGKPTAMRIEEAADRWAFLASELDMDFGSDR